jgi:signal transduction histidine kinase
MVAAETLLPLAEKRGLTIETSGDKNHTIGSHALLLQLTTNLVHNAIVHNLPEQGTVWVTTRAHPNTVDGQESVPSPHDLDTLVSWRRPLAEQSHWSLGHRAASERQLLASWQPLAPLWLSLPDARTGWRR